MNSKNKVQTIDKIGCGLRLKYTRKALGFSTSRSFAEAIKIEEDTLTAWERGQNLVPLWFIRVLKEVFGITSDWIYFNDISSLKHTLALKIIDAEDIDFRF